MRKKKILKFLAVAACAGLCASTIFSNLGGARIVKAAGITGFYDNNYFSGNANPRGLSVYFGVNPNSTSSDKRMVWKLVGKEDGGIVAFASQDNFKNSNGQNSYQFNSDTSKGNAYAGNPNLGMPESDIRKLLASEATNTNRFNSREQARMKTVSIRSDYYYDNDTGGLVDGMFSDDKLYLPSTPDGKYVLKDGNQYKGLSFGRGWGSINITSQTDYSRYIYGGSGDFWTRSAHYAASDEVISAYGGGQRAVKNRKVNSFYALRPVCHIDTSDIVFASSVDAASGETGTAPKTSAYTLRYNMPTNSRLFAIIESNKTEVLVTGLNLNNRYLVVQNSNGAYKVKLSGTSQTVLASDISLNGFSSFDDTCKVWVETTDQRMTYAKMATYSNETTVYNVDVSATIPTAGQTVGSATVSVSNGGTFRNYYWCRLDGGVESSSLGASETFEAGKSYRLITNIDANNGTKFHLVQTVVKYNGQNATGYSSRRYSDSIYSYYDFTVATPAPAPAPTPSNPGSGSSNSNSGGNLGSPSNTGGISPSGGSSGYSGSTSGLTTDSSFGSSNRGSSSFSPAGIGSYGAGSRFGSSSFGSSSFGSSRSGFGGSSFGSFGSSRSSFSSTSFGSYGFGRSSFGGSSFSAGGFGSFGARSGFGSYSGFGGSSYGGMRGFGSSSMGYSGFGRSSFTTSGYGSSSRVSPGFIGSFGVSRF